MGSSVLVCGAVFDGIAEELSGPTEILVEEGRISAIDRTVDRPDGAEVIDLSERTVSPGFIDTHVHLTMDASDLPAQTLASASTKALKGLSLARYPRCALAPPAARSSQSEGLEGRLRAPRRPRRG